MGIVYLYVNCTRGKFLVNILLSAILISVIIYKRTYKHWAAYHTTILYGSLMIVLYDFICQDYLLWKHSSFPFYSHFAGELIHAFIIMPCIVLLFLHNFSEQKKLLYILKWALISFFIEGAFVVTDSITFHNGYRYIYDLPFYSVMYLMFYLHHKRPILTYGLSIFIIIGLIFLFDVKLPLDE